MSILERKTKGEISNAKNRLERKGGQERPPDTGTY